MSAALLALITLVASGSSTSRADESPTVRSAAIRNGTERWKRQSAVGLG
jgi:hypothetical protein